MAGVIKNLVKEGKVLHWGLSEPGVNTIRRAFLYLSKFLQFFPKTSELSIHKKFTHWKQFKRLKITFSIPEHFFS